MKRQDNPRKPSRYLSYVLRCWREPSVQAGREPKVWRFSFRDVEGNPIAGVTYDVYRAQDLPYFSPVAPYAAGVSSTTYLDPDAGVIGDPRYSYYYLVRAAYGGLTSSDSNRVGSFSFALAPGSP